MAHLTPLLLLFLLWAELCCSTPVSSANWQELVSTNGIKFSGRNAHASCVFKGQIWLTGGRTAAYTTYALLESFKVADVWRSSTGALWAKERELTGDFFAQNTDVTQPGPIAPWYARFGHSLNSVDINGDGVDDYMILMGGYSPKPSNDIWITEDGRHWVYCGYAPWSARAWHGTTIFHNNLFLMGGSPLNNEVWMLVNVTKVSREMPLTRSMYSNYTYQLDWIQQPDAPWSPRVGMGLVSQWFFNKTDGETLKDSRERIVLAGGYGGYPAVEPNIAKYDGFITRADTWQTFDGQNWTQLNWNNTFGGRAWFGMDVHHAEDPRVQYPARNSSHPPKMYIVGGGFTGFLFNRPGRVSSMQGKADAYWSTDGTHWVKISYEEGGGTTTVPFFASQEWSKTIVDTQVRRLGKWGMTLHSFNLQTKKPHGGELILLAGDYTGGGEFSPAVYKNLAGIYCDVEGVICNNHGTCGARGCSCDEGFTGDFCQGTETVLKTGAAPTSLRQLLHISVALGVTLSTVASALLSA